MWVRLRKKEKERVLSPSAHLYFEEIRKEGEKSGRGLDQMRAAGVAANYLKESFVMRLEKEEPPPRFTWQ